MFPFMSDLVNNTKGWGKSSNDEAAQTDQKQIKS